jgi:hypothetical protein
MYRILECGVVFSAARDRWLKESVSVGSVSGQRVRGELFD